MTKAGIIKKTERWETHHRIVAFCIVVVSAIVVTRFGIAVYYPGYLVLDGTRLHHFDYGLVLLLISSQLALFGPKKFKDLYVVLVAIGSGLILDEYWMIRHGINPLTAPGQEYNSTIPSSAVAVMILLLGILFVHSILRHRKKK
jgi:hypothetical protein